MTAEAVATEATSINQLAEHLKSLGITSGRNLAQHTQSPAVIFFLAKNSEGNADPRAELHSKRGVRVFRPTGMDEHASLSSMRRRTVEAATQAAASSLGLEDWHKTPFSNCWLPAEAINRMRAELGTDPIN